MQFFTILTKFLVFICVLLQRACHGDRIVDVIDGAYLNIADHTPDISFIETTNLYSDEVNVLYNVYQRSYNGTLTETLKVITGNTTINSTSRCIAYGYSFYNWGPIPIQYPDKKGNGGCDALWGEECSQHILTRIRETPVDDINTFACGTHIPDIFPNPPPNCSPKNLFHTQLSLMKFLHNNTFMEGLIPPIMNVSRPWVYFQSSPSVDGNYHELMKSFVFTYFIGREYTSDNVEAAIACFSIYNTTIPSGTITQFSVSRNFLIFLSFFIIFLNIFS